jgi:hypothetical protein
VTDSGHTKKQHCSKEQRHDFDHGISSVSYEIPQTRSSCRNRYTRRRLNGLINWAEALLQKGRFYKGKKLIPQ